MSSSTCAPSLWIFQREEHEERAPSQQPCDQASIQSQIDGHKIICHCMRVSKAEIVSAICDKGACSLKEVKEITQAGTGCTCCHRQIEKIIHQIGVQKEGENDFKSRSYK